MSSTKHLIDKCLSGRSAQYLIDSMVEDLPPLPALYSTIRKELPRHAKVNIEESTVFIEDCDRIEIEEKVHYLSLVYPELDFVVK